MVCSNSERATNRKKTMGYYALANTIITFVSVDVEVVGSREDGDE